VGLEWRGRSTREDVSSFRLPAMGLDVFIGTLLEQASLHSVDRTGGIKIPGIVNE
jgi:hypothetical protein